MKENEVQLKDENYYSAASIMVGLKLFFGVIGMENSQNDNYLCHLHM